MPDTPVSHDAQVGGTDVARSPPVLDEQEQTLADGDQTLSDADQTSADSDQTSAERDQWAADRDQAARDRDLAAGVDRHEYDLTRDVRLLSALQRERSSQARLDAAFKRDEIAGARDLAALARDQAADARDLAMAQLDAASEQADGARALTGGEILVRAAKQRRRAAGHRAQAAEQRALAAQDRLAAAQDRAQAAAERQRALADREALAREVAVAETDSLTGVRTRAAGLADLDRELDRCRRTSGVLVLTYIDVVGLKALNDAEGHAVGDELLKRVVTSVRQHLRPYDLMVRIGGDEFLCVMSNMTQIEARRRFRVIAAELAAPPPAAITTGFAELAPDEASADLIRRANRELIAGRNGHERKRLDLPAGEPRRSHR